MRNFSILRESTVQWPNTMTVTNTKFRFFTLKYWFPLILVAVSTAVDWFHHSSRRTFSNNNNCLIYGTAQQCCQHCLLGWIAKMLASRDISMLSSSWMFHWQKTRLDFFPYFQSLNWESVESDRRCSLKINHATGIEVELTPRGNFCWNIKGVQKRARCGSTSTLDSSNTATQANELVVGQNFKRLPSCRINELEVPSSWCWVSRSRRSICLSADDSQLCHWYLPHIVSK